MCRDTSNNVYFVQQVVWGINRKINTLKLNYCIEKNSVKVA